MNEVAFLLVTRRTPVSGVPNWQVHGSSGGHSHWQTRSPAYDYIFCSNDSLSVVDPYGLVGITWKGCGSVVAGLGTAFFISKGLVIPACVCGVVTVGLGLWEIYDNKELLDAIQKWAKEQEEKNTKDSDGDGVADKYDPFPNDPND